MIGILLDSSYGLNDLAYTILVSGPYIYGTKTEGNVSDYTVTLLQGLEGDRRSAESVENINHNENVS